MLSREGFRLRESVPQKTIKVVFDFGARKANLSLDKPIRSSLTNVAGIDTFNVSEINLESFDPQHTLVIMGSSTVDYSRYEKMGFLTYPSRETLDKISNKWFVYEWCRRNNIPTALTFRAPRQILPMDGISERVERIGQRLSGVIAKPETSLGKHRDVIGHFQDLSAETLQQYASPDGQIPDVDFVVQKRLKGLAKKVFGVWPDQYFYLDSDDLVKPCPPSIKRTCKRVAEEFNLPFGGLDFMVSEEGVWLLIDINPPAGGRALPSSADPERFRELMSKSAERLVLGKPIPRAEHKIQVMIAAAGEGKRLGELTHGGPKSLLSISDGKSVLDFSSATGIKFSENEGYNFGVRLVSNCDHVTAFNEWRRNNGKTDVDIAVPDSDLYGTNSSFNHIMASLPDNTDHVLCFAADRIVSLDAEQVKATACEVKRAFDDSMPFVVVGVLDNNSIHRYITDDEGRILSCGAGGDLGVGVKKICTGFDTAKAGLVEARNSFDACQRLTHSGVLGRLILLDSETSVYDIDTDKELMSARNMLGH